MVASKMPVAAEIRVQLRPKLRVLIGILGWEARKLNCINRVFGAGDGNRTHVRSLGSFYTAIVRRPLCRKINKTAKFLQEFFTRSFRARVCVRLEHLRCGWRSCDDTGSVFVVPTSRGERSRTIRWAS